MEINVNIPIKKIIYILLSVVIFLTISSLITSALITNILNVEFFGQETIIDFFYLDSESNLPTWFSTMLLALNAIMLFLISYRARILKQRYFFLWLLLGCIFIGLSIDEFATLHEILIIPVRTALKPEGLLTFAWFIPVVFALIIMAIFYLPFLFHLPSYTRNMFILAALVYLGGAIGMEAVGGLRASTVDALEWKDILADVPYNLLMTAEEVLEMLGALFFFYTLSQYTYEHQSHKLPLKNKQEA